MPLRIVEGDLLNQPVEVVVNAWNRNPFPWWLLMPQGVSGAIRRKAGTQPFRELCRRGLIPLGGAVLTSAGTLPCKAIIHVAGINLLWRATPTSVQMATASALTLARAKGFASIAFPLIGAGTGGLSASEVEAVMTTTIRRHPYSGAVTLVRYAPDKVEQPQR